MDKINKEMQNRKLEKLLISLKQINGKEINTWNISDVLSDFASLYYKIDLIDTLVEVFKSGVSPSEIIIFNRSLDIKKNNYNFDSLDFDEDIYSIYKLGSPVSMFPNTKIIELRILFDLYYDISKEMKEINKLLILQQIDLLGIDRLTECYRIYKKDGLVKAIHHIIGNAISKLPEDAKKFRNNLRSIEKNYLDSYEIYTNKRKAIKNTSTKLKTNYISDFRNIEHSEYFYNFFRLFELYEKPLIGISRKETSRIDFLCDHHFNQNTNKNSLLLTIEKITHNSPYEMIFSGLKEVILPFLIPYIILKIEEYHKSEKENTDSKKDIYLKLKHLYDKKKQNLDINIEVKFLHTMFNEQTGILLEKFNRLLEIYSFEINMLEDKD